MTAKKFFRALRGRLIGASRLCSLHSPLNPPFQISRSATGLGMRTGVNWEWGWEWPGSEDGSDRGVRMGVVWEWGWEWTGNEARSGLEMKMGVVWEWVWQILILYTITLCRWSTISHLLFHQCLAIEVDHVENEQTAGGILEGRFLWWEVKS